jgi:hypothetical protein
MAVQKSIGHSSIVRMVLHLDGAEVPVAQMGPDFLILKETFSSSALEGVVTLTVDGVSEEIPVLLPRGIPATSKRIEIAEAETLELAAA